MDKKTLLLVFFICFSASSAFAEENIDLNGLTSQCVYAASKHETIENSVAYKVLHTVEYEGWSGDSNNFTLTYPVTMIITYAGAERNGYYWFRNNPQKKYNVSARSDFNGNFELVENSKNGDENYTFRGLMQNGIIKGLWEKGNGKKAFAFYVRVIKEKQHNIK